MSQERPGDSFSDSDDAKRGAQSSGPAAAHAEPHGFTIQTGGRNAMADTAERIGRAAGTAHRQVRRGLELVRPAAGTASPYGYVLGSAGRSNALENDELAARAMQSIEEELAEIRHEAAHRLGEISEVAAEGLLQVRERLHEAASRSRRLITDYPVQTMAALASFCLVFGATLCLRGSSRR